jgi:hypothetical protein
MVNRPQLSSLASRSLRGNRADQSNQIERGQVQDDATSLRATRAEEEEDQVKGAPEAGLS